MKLGAKQLIARLPVVDENVLAEAARNPIFFMDAARYRVAKMRERAQAEAGLEYAESKLSLKIRQKYRAEKLTEGAIKAKVRISSSVRMAGVRFNNTQANEELSKLILEAYRYRRDAIRILAEARVYEGARESVEVDRIETRRKLVQRARALEEKRHRTEE